MEQNPLNRRIRILALGDAPTVKTGFGRVNRELFSRLPADKYDVTWVGVNYHATPLDVMQKWPQPIISANPAGGQPDVHGRQLAADFLQAAAQQGEPFDIFWTHNDIPVAHGFANALRDGMKDVCKLAGVVFYSPLDSELHSAPQWLEVTSLVDVYATYTWWSKLEIEKYSPANMKVFYIGQDPKWCCPLDDKVAIQKFRSKVLGVEDPDTFVISSINRNQERKDLPRLMAAFRDFLKLVPNSLLYMHVDPVEWIDLNLVAFKLGIEKKVKFLGSQNAQVVQDDFMQLVYNASHCIATLSRGEGWGLSVTEAMGTKTPVVAAHNTATHDLLGQVQNKVADFGEGRKVHLAERGVAVPSGMTQNMLDTDPSLWIVGQDVMLRPMANLDCTVAAFQFVHGQYESLAEFRLKEHGKLKPIVDAAYEWVREKLDWDRITEQWDKVFTALVKAREQGIELPKPVRQGGVPDDGTINM